MKQVRCQTITTVLVLGLLTGILLSGCYSSGDTRSTAKSVDTGSNTTNNERLKLTIVQPNADPNGTNLSDNPWINIVKNKANVDLEVK